MINQNIDLMLNNCKEELKIAGGIKQAVGASSPVMMFITRYILIKVCGTIELAYKTIVADFCESTQSVQVKNFISDRVRNSSDNPTIQNICRLLNSFDKNWNKNFKKKIKLLSNREKIILSLTSLNDARNVFAHGGSPSVSFDDVVNYFDDACIMIKLLDEVVNSSQPQQN